MKTALRWIAALAAIFVSGATAQLTPIPFGPYTPSTFTANGVLYGNGTSAIQATAQGAANSILTANAGAPAFSQTPTINTQLRIGVASSQTGSIVFRNATNANTFTLQPGATGANLTFTLPIADAARALVSDGAGTLSFATLGTGAGGTGLTTATDDAVILGNGTNWTASAVPNCTDAGGNHLNYTAATNTFSCGNTGTAGALSGLTAATGANTIANGDNLQTWQWQKTTNSSGAFRFTESAASTGGTSTGGVPNQYILRADTIAASTASPLTVYSRGAHVFSVSPSAQAILAADTSAPVYSFAAAPTAGLYYDTGNSAVRTDATKIILNSGASGIHAVHAGISSFFTSAGFQTEGRVYTIAGTQALPAYTFTGDTDTGLVNIAADTILVSTGNTESIRFTSGGPQLRNSILLSGVSTSCGFGVSGAVTDRAYTDCGGEKMRWTSSGTHLGGSAQLVFGVTAPTIASGGCTGPAVTWNNGTAAFLITIGTSCTGVKTVTLTLPAATNLWACRAENNTSDAQQAANMVVARATSTTAVVLTNYARTTGVQADFTASDTVLVSCIGG